MTRACVAPTHITSPIIILPLQTGQRSLQFQEATFNTMKHGLRLLLRMSAFGTVLDFIANDPDLFEPAHILDPLLRACP